MGKDTDQRARAVANDDRSTDGARIGTVTPLPKPVADDDDRRFDRTVVDMESAAK